MNLPTTHAYLMVLSDRLWHPNDIFKQYPDINKIFLFHSLGVHPDYRRNGIAKQLVTKGFEVCSYTGKSLSEALLLAEHGENMLSTKIVLSVKNNFCTQHDLPMF